MILFQRMPFKFAWLIVFVSAVCLLVLQLTIQVNLGDDAANAYLMAYVSNRSGQNDIYLASAKGDYLRRLTFSAEKEQLLTWQPNGNRLLFTAQAANRNSNLQAVRLPSGTTTILNTSVSTYSSLNWLPDGQSFSFSARVDDYRRLYFAQAGTRPSVFLKVDYDVYAADWHSDNTLFVSAVPLNSLDILRYSPAEDAFYPVVESSDTESQPAVSPDGRYLAYVRFREGKSEIAVYDFDLNLNYYATAHGAYSLSPHWTPDGRWIVYSTNKDGNYEIYRMRPDGSQSQNLTNSRADETSPAISSTLGFQSHAFLLAVVALGMVGLSSFFLMRN